MGAIAKHGAAQVGTTQAEKAEKRGLAKIDEGNERLTMLLDAVAGDNGFKVEKVADAFLQFVMNMEEGASFLDSSPALTASKGDSSSMPTPHHGKPSQAELLGEKLLKLFGDQADTILNTLGHAAATDPTLVVGFLPQATARVKAGEPLVNIGGVYAFQADRDTEKTKRDYERSFLDLVAYISGGAVPDGKPISVYFRDAKKVIDDLNSAAVATPDEATYFAAIEASTAVKPNSGETFKDYLTRALSEVATATNTEHLDWIGKRINFDRNTGESNRDYAERLRKELERLVKTNAAYWAEFGYLTKLAQKNGVAYLTDDNCAAVAQKLIDHANAGGTGISPADHKWIIDWASKNGVNATTTSPLQGIITTVLNHNDAGRGKYKLVL